MKAVFKTSDVLPHLTQVASIINPKIAIPILSNIHFKQTDKEFILTASDSETWITSRCPLVESDGEYNYCIPANDFIKSLRNLGDTELEMTLDEDSKVLTCTYDKGNFRLPYSDAEQYPQPNVNMDKAQERILNSKSLQQAIELSSTAVANDELRPVMNGIHFDFFKDRMVCASSDGQKLIKYSDYGLKHDEEIVYQFTLPKRPVSLLLNVLASMDADVKVRFTERNVCVSNQAFKMTARLVDGRYPNYDSVIPQESAVKAIVKNDDLQQALKRVIPLGNINSMLVVFSFADNKLTVAAEDIDLSKSAKETIDCEYTAEPLKIGFKGSLIMELLRNINDENVVMEMTNETKPCVIYAKDALPKDNYLSLLMPMLINV